MQRVFTSAQKLQILRRANYIANYMCQICGVTLTPKNFEADHAIAYALGGATEVWNAQALCITCNRRKSNKPQ